MKVLTPASTKACISSTTWEGVPTKALSRVQRPSLRTMAACSLAPTLRRPNHETSMLAGSRPSSSQCCCRMARRSLKVADGGVRVVPAVGILRGQAHGLAATAANDDGRQGLRARLAPGVADLIVASLPADRAGLAPHARHDFERVLQLLDADAGARVRPVVGAVLIFLPAGADAHDETAVADGLQGGAHLCQQGRVAVALAQHHRANEELRPAGGDVAHDRPGLVARLVVPDEVVGHPQALEVALQLRQGEVEVVP